MRHYSFRKTEGVYSFCFGEGELSEALANGASEIVDHGRVYLFRDRHGFPTWVSEGMAPGIWGDLSEEAFEEVTRTGRLTR